MKLIDKDVLVVKLKRLQNALQDPAMNRESMRDYAYGGNKIINEILSFLDTLEVKEADLDGEYERFLDEVEGVPRLRHSDEQIEWAKDIAKHFFELGLKLQKGE